MYIYVSLCDYVKINMWKYHMAFHYKPHGSPVGDKEDPHSTAYNSGPPVYTRGCNTMFYAHVASVRRPPLWFSPSRTCTPCPSWQPPAYRDDSRATTLCCPPADRFTVACLKRIQRSIPRHTLLSLFR